MMHRNEKWYSIQRFTSKILAKRSTLLPIGALSKLLLERVHSSVLRGFAGWLMTQVLADLKKIKNYHFLLANENRFQYSCFK